MSTKQEVFDQLKRLPDTSLKELLGIFSAQNPSTVRRYYFEFKLDEKPVNNPKASGSLRNQVMDYLSKHPDAESGELYQAFNKANRKTIRNYLHQFRTERKKRSSIEKVEQKVFNYLDKHPHINLNDLKIKFPDGGKKLITIFRNWKKKREESGLLQKKKTAKQAPAISESSQQEIINSLKKLIEKQKATIEQQKATIKELKARSAKSLNIGVASLKKLLRNPLSRTKK